MSAVETLESVAKIAKGITATAELWKNVGALLGLLQNEEGINDILHELDNISSMMSAGFGNIVNAIEEQTDKQSWSDFSSLLNTMQRNNALYLSQFKSLDKTSMKVTVNSQEIDFRTWCEGEGSHGDDGAIGVLAAQVDNLWSYLKAGGAGNLPVLEIWDKLCNVEQSGTDSVFAGQTHYSMLYQLMQEIFVILAASYYARENALKIYQASYPESRFSYVPLDQSIRDKFGNVDNVDSVWGMFAQRLSTYVKPTATPWDDYKVCATSCDSYPGNDSYYDPAAENCIGWYLGPTHISDAGLGSNAFFASVQLIVRKWTGDIRIPARDENALERIILADTDNMEPETKHGTYDVICLAGTPVQIGKNFTFTTGDPVTPLDKISLIDLASGTVGFATGIMAGYCRTPQPPSPHLIPVITGFQLQNLDNSLSLLLQYSFLDTSDASNPIVVPVEGNIVAWGVRDRLVVNWHEYEDPPARPTGVDTRPSGTADNFPITNLALSLTKDTGTDLSTGSRIGLIAQSAWPIYRADFFQPDKALAAWATEAPPV